MANNLSGVFSGTGGCAMIGQSLTNISSGARACRSFGYAILVGAIIAALIFACENTKRIRARKSIATTKMLKIWSEKFLF